MRDISSEYEAEHALKRQAAELQTFYALAENAPDGVLVASIEGEISYANTAMRALLGFDGNQLLGVQVLAHIDFPRRMWPWSAGPYSEQAFEAEYRAVLRTLAAGDRVLEVNTKSPLLSAELVGWWREAGGKAVSFGSDAHQPWRVGDKFKLAVDMVEAAGFRAGRDRFDFWRR